MKIRQIFIVLFAILSAGLAWASDRLIYDCPDNPVRVCIEIPAPEYLANGGSIEAIKAEREAQGIFSVIVPQSTIPTDRTYRNAWKKNLGNIETDMVGARIIHMKRILRERDKELERLDKESFRNMEEFRSNIATLQKKKKLRDIETTFSLQQFKTPETLKQAWPAELPKQ